MRFSCKSFVLLHILKYFLIGAFGLVNDDREIKRIGGFTFEYYKDNFDGTKSIIASPFAVREILTSLYTFVQPQIQAQMRDVLRLVVHPSLFDQVKQDLHSFAESPDITFENGLYLQRGVRLNPALFRFGYAFQFLGTNFKNKTRFEKDINNWVLETTRGKLKNSLIEGQTNDLTTLFLVNVILLKGEWQNKFHSRDSVPRRFNTFDGRRSMVDTLKTVDYFQYYCHYKMQYKLLEMTLTTDSVQKFVMWIFLPIEGQTFPEMVTKLTFTNILQASQRMKLTKVNVQVPKFQISSRLDVKDVLESLGIEDFFENGVLNITSSGRQEPLDGFMQMSYIELTEEGIVKPTTKTKDVPKTRNSVQEPEKGPEYFVCDQPFMFMILTTEKRPILIGHYTGP